MHFTAAHVVGYGLALSHFTNALPTPQEEDDKPAYIAAGTGLTYPPDNAEASSELSSLMKKINNWDTPLLEGDCSPYEETKGIKIEPDNANAFQASEEYHKLANDAPTPDGWTRQYTDLHGAISYHAKFLAGTILSEYDPGSCAAFSDLYDGDVFNLLAMRVPTLRLNHTDCPNAPSQTAYGCSVWSGEVDEKPTIGKSFWADFELTVAASNIYARSKESKRDLGERDCHGALSERDCAEALVKRECNGAPIILNGGFEADNPAKINVPSDWYLSNIVGTVTFGLTKPGNGDSTYALLASLKANNPEQEEYTGSSFVLSQKLNTCAGQSYNITLDFRYDEAADGKCLFSYGIVGSDDAATDYDGDTYDGSWSDAAPPQTWYSRSSGFKASKPNEVLVIFVGCQGDVTNAYSIDNVVVTPVGEPSKA